jgi:hypothetical protein
VARGDARGSEQICRSKQVGGGLDWGGSNPRGRYHRRQLIHPKLGHYPYAGPFLFRYSGCGVDITETTPEVAMKLQSNLALRAALHIDHVTWKQHHALVTKVANTHPHSIEFVDYVDGTTCAPLALRLTDVPMYDAVRNKFRDTHPKAFAGRSFMTWLTQGRLAEISSPKDGCLVCYFSAKGWEHIGLFKSGRVRSKWGEHGIYNHDLAEVPDQYGDCVRFYERPTSERSLALFRAYVRELGLSDEEIGWASRTRR